MIMNETKVSDCRAKSSGCAGLILNLTPILSVFLAMCTVAFSIYQYHSQRQLEERIRLRSQIRSDLDQLTTFPKNKALTLSEVEFLLGDLDELIQRSADAEGKPESAQNDRKRITKVLYDSAQQDCNYDEQRDVDFSIKVFDSWTGYKDYLKSDSELIWDLLFHYNDSLGKLHGQIPRFISQIEYDKKTSQYTEPPGTTDAEDSHLRHFEDLVIGFNKHLELLDQGSQLRNDLIKQFQAATCNEKLTKAQFGLSFDPKSDPGLFSDCLKDTEKR